jgi:hypothetical protein
MNRVSIKQPWQLKVENDAAIEDTREGVGSLLSIIEHPFSNAKMADIPLALKERAAVFEQ